MHAPLALQLAAALVAICATSVASTDAAAAVAAASMYAKTKACPLTAAMKDFDLRKFTGDWYVLEYEYPKKMDLHSLTCVGLHYSLTSFGDVLSNFTFRFPPNFGHFYHVPTFSLVTQVEPAVWETQFKGVDLMSVVVSTDYDSYAVVVQCLSDSDGSGGEPRFLSTRILSRGRSLTATGWLKVEETIEAADAAAPFRYPVLQAPCKE